jgi:DNA-binding beta-propeller fold protein YncE
VKNHAFVRRGRAGVKSGTIPILTLLFIAGLISCGGGGSSTSSSNQTSGVKVRAFVSNAFNGVLDIIDAQHDQLVQGHTIQVGVQPGMMAVSPDKSYTLVFDNGGGNRLVKVSNSQETQTGSVVLPGLATSFVISPDNNSAFAAVPTAVSLGQPSGILQVVDAANMKLSFVLNVPAVSRLVINHSGTRVLAFSNASDSVTIIDTSLLGRGTPTTTLSGFDRPVYGVFTDDDSTAFIMNCGPECGGVHSSVTALNMSRNAPTTTVGVAGATIGALINGTLYVAGSASGAGTLQAIDTSTLSPAAPVAIGPGSHSLIALASNNKLFIGAQGCGGSRQGCLSVFDVGAGTAVIDTPSGDVTGIGPIANRSVCYVIEGGELRVFDTNTGKPSTSAFIDIVGAASDVKEVD